MPLPPDVLEEIKAKINAAEEAVKGIEDVMADLRATGVGVGEQETRLKEAKEDLRKLRLFYERQSKRVGTTS